MSDRELLDRLSQGDQDAFDIIFRGHYARLVGLADGILRERAPAEEIAQEVMLELWRRRESLVVDTSLTAYLFRATRNRALNYIRHQRVARRGNPMAVPETTSPATAHAEVVQAEIDAAVQRALEHLPARCREVFELSRVHGLKYAEIAATLEISIKTVEAQMGKALRIMREQLTDWLT